MKYKSTVSVICRRENNSVNLELRSKDGDEVRAFLSFNKKKKSIDIGLP